MTEAGEHVAELGAQLGVILDQQGQPARTVICKRRAAQRQAQGDPGAWAGVADLDRPACQLDHVVDHRQPQPGSGTALGGEEGIEPVFQRLGREPRATVTHRQFQPGVRDGAHLDSDPPARRAAGVPRVKHEVQRGILQQPEVEQKGALWCGRDL